MSVDVDTLRALIGDIDGNAFEDEQLEAAITAAGGEENANPLRAAGNAFLALAATYALLGRSVKTDDLGIDTRARGTDLLKVAQSYFAEAAAGDAIAGSEAFEIVAFGGRTSDPACRVEATPYPVCCGGSCGGCVL